MDSIKSVLIVDDDEDDIFLIQDRLDELARSSVEYVTCSEKQIAIRFLKERTFDLCILDYRLAGFKGTEILEAVADAELSTPIVMLTGQNDDEIAKQVIKLGAQDFVMKSLIDENVFDKSIQYAIARKELAFAKNLSQRKEAENVAKDKFIAHLSHELRTPLTSILGYTSLLLEDQKAAAFTKELSIISKNGKHLLSLLNDVLDLSKIAAGKFELREQETDLQQLLSEINSLVVVNALDKGLFLEFYSLGKLPKTLLIDSVRFKQVLLNIVGNAIKFTDSGGVKVSFEFKIQTSDLIIKIKDTGIGMKQSEKHIIFSPFKQIEDVADRKAGGAGLGLSICNEIVKQMRGELNVLSTLGEGSEFTLAMPCKLLSDELININFDTNNEVVSAIPIPKLEGNLLVVDDLFEIRQLVGFYSQQTGLQVQYAKNGQHALDMLSTNLSENDSNTCAFDCVLMDLHMPVMTGKEAMVKINKLFPNVPVIAMTAAIAKGLKEDLIDKGFCNLIAKPIDKQSLWGTLSSVLPKTELTDTQSTQTKKITDKTLIHLIEDDMDSAEVMQMMLTKLGCEVIHSSTGQEAVENMCTENVQFHLVDLGLPDLSSESLLQAITANHYNGHIYILSGEQPNLSILQKYGIRDHLVKPISFDNLRQTIGG